MIQELVLLNIDLQWDRYLNAAPDAVVTLAQLVNIAVYNDDFPLYFIEPTSSEDLRHSHIRPTLIQLVNKARRVFKEASDEMKQIKTNIEKMPGNVKSIVGFLATGDVDDLSEDLPKVASFITDTAKKCSHQAIEIENWVITLIQLVGEIDQRLTKTAVNLSQTLQHQSASDGNKALLNKNLAMTQRAIQAIGTLKRQLNLALRFFHVVSFVADVFLQKSVESLVHICRQLSYNPELVKEFLRDDPTLAVRDTLVSDSSRVVKASGFLKTVIEVYISASDQYILNSLKSLPKLQTASKAQMEQVLQQLAKQSNVARSAIEDIAKAKRKTFKETVNKSDNELRAMLTPIEPNRLQQSSSKT